MLGGAADSLGAAHIAARLGLETTGITLPLTRIADKVRTPEREPSPILVGRSNALVERLVKIGKARLDDLQPGEGAVQVVPKAFGNADRDGRRRRRCGRHRCGRDVSRPSGAVRVGQRARLDLAWRRRAAGRTVFCRRARPQGRRARSTPSSTRWLADVKDKTLESIDVKLFVEQADPALDAYVAGEAAARAASRRR